MFRNLFSPDSQLMITMTRITDFIFLSLFWLLCSFPVVTMGASFAALYDASYRTFRQNEKNSWQRFWAVFRQNWKSGIVPSILFVAAFAGLLKLAISCWNAAVAGAMSWMLFSAIAFALMVLLGILSLLFPVLSRFENSLVGLLKNTLLLALANLPRTAVLGVLNAVVLFACVRWVVPLFFLPSVAAMLGSHLIEPMFKPYMNADENAAC
jgi:uncharacterized membrane protein YesL